MYTIRYFPPPAASCATQVAAISENRTPFVLSQAHLHSAGKSASTYLVDLPVYVHVCVYENQRVFTLQTSLSMFVCVCERERVKGTKREREKERY